MKSEIILIVLIISVLFYLIQLALAIRKNASLRKSLRDLKKFYKLKKSKRMV